jgi:hypothetical protein
LKVSPQHAQGIIGLASLTTKRSLIAGVTLPANEIQSLLVAFDAAPIVSALLAKREMPLAAFDAVPVTPVTAIRAPYVEPKVANFLGRFARNIKGRIEKVAKDSQSYAAW